MFANSQPTNTNTFANNIVKFIKLLHHIINLYQYCLGGGGVVIVVTGRRSSNNRSDSSWCGSNSSGGGGVSVCTTSAFAKSTGSATTSIVRGLPKIHAKELMELNVTYEKQNHIQIFQRQQRVPLFSKKSCF